MSTDRVEDCIFCKIAAGEIETEFEYEDDHVVAFKDLNSQAPVHCLIIPKKHIPRINDVDDSEILNHLFRAANELAKKYGIDDDGFRLVINSGNHGGQTVYHLHLHVLGGRFMRWPPG